MALRVYTDRAGEEWRVWLVMPASAGVPMLDESFRDGWLCFERVDGADRRRLSMADVPAVWEALPDDRLDLLRRMAAPATRRTGATNAADLADPSALETRQRDARSSGPKSAIGGEEEEY
jgi:hypothetical protein